MSKKTPRQKTSDELLKTSKEGEIELTEQELGKVSGGTKAFTRDKIDPSMPPMDLP